jgi:hypothetical protein
MLAKKANSRLASQEILNFMELEGSLLGSKQHPKFQISYQFSVT